MFQVEDNKESAAKLDFELEKCQQEMEHLKKELAYATRCVNDLEINMMVNGSDTESNTEAHTAGNLASNPIIILCSRMNDVMSNFMFVLVILMSACGIAKSI